MRDLWRPMAIAATLAVALCWVTPRLAIGQVWGRNNGPSGNSFPNLLTDPSAPGTVYGWNDTELRRSIDGGQTWQTPSSSGLGEYGRVVVDPTQSGVLLAVDSGHLFRSTDHGDSWTLVNANLPLGLVQFDAAGGFLFAGDQNGDLFRSTDGGLSWTATQIEMPVVEGLQDTARFVRFDPQTAAVGYVLSYFRFVWRTTDGGLTWTPTQKLSLFGGINGNDIGLPTGFEVDSVNHALYVNTTYYFYRSINGGKKWTKSGSGGISLAIDPHTSSSLYRIDGDGLWRSIDGGKRWVLAQAGLTGVPIAVAFDQIAAAQAYVATQQDYTTTISNGVFVQVCGNGSLDAGESCDDGNFADGDGCSSRCRVEHYLDAGEQKCVDGDNVAGAAVAKAELADDLRCFKAGAAGNEPDPQACTAADANHKVQTAQSKLSAKDTAVCTSVAPSYAYTSPTTAGDAAANEARALITDLFGTNFDTAQIKTAADSVGAACQKEVLIASQNLFKQYITSFVSCKKKRLAGKLWPTIGSAADLEECWDEPDSNSLSRASDRLSNAAAGKCFGVNVNNAFPNGESDPIQRAYFQVRCRACLMFNHMDGLNRNCDAFDGGAAGSCPD
ncbi:MAG TPA: hypothetical protein VMT89_16020 [Candidatus Acidoferrales bacterium]|nr:hypothetical protein [Candidatus Acidoferrales bacterium]